MLAIHHGYTEIARELLVHSNTDVNLKNNIGSTALMYVGHKGHPEIARLLL